MKWYRLVDNVGQVHFITIYVLLLYKGIRVLIVSMGRIKRQNTISTYCARPITGPSPSLVVIPQTQVCQCTRGAGSLDILVKDGLSLPPLLHHRIRSLLTCIGTSRGGRHCSYNPCHSSHQLLLQASHQGILQTPVPDLIEIWSRFGRDLFQIWSRFGPDWSSLVQSRSRFGPDRSRLSPDEIDWTWRLVIALHSLGTWHVCTSLTSGRTSWWAQVGVTCGGGVY